jgi:hypothetical protein
MVLEYIHNSTMSAHLEMTKKLNLTGKVSYSPGMRIDVCNSVRKYQDYHRAKPARDS